MPTYLFIAEKPSLMRDVKKCYEKHKREVVSKVGYIDFTALSGHVCTFYEPNDYEGWNGKWDDVAYPIVPNDWGVKPINDNWKKSALKKIKDMFRARVRVAPSVSFEKAEYIAKLQMPPMSRKAVKFIDMR